MTAQHGSTQLPTITHGTTPILWAQKGSTIVWQLAVPGDDFNTAGPLNSTNWADVISGSAFKIACENGYGRVNVPDGILSGTYAFVTSAFRYSTTVLPGDDCYVEVRPATKGASASLLGTYATQAWCRGNNSGSGFTNGWAIHMEAGHVWIAVNTGSGTSKKVNCGTFQAMDVIRLQVQGNVGTLYVNGVTQTGWAYTDTTNAVGKSSAYRSLIIRQDGEKIVLGPRAFSPALDYVKMGSM